MADTSPKKKVAAKPKKPAAPGSTSSLRLFQALVLDTSSE
jgi:hypothetical protein